MTFIRVRRNWIQYDFKELGMKVHASSLFFLDVEHISLIISILLLIFSLPV